MTVDSLQSTTLPVSHTFTQLKFEYDVEYRILWGYMVPDYLPNFNLQLLKEVRTFDLEFARNAGHITHLGQMAPVEFYVAASKVPGIFNLGGDLALFFLLIKSRNRPALAHYAHLCIENLYSRISKFGNSQLTTIGLIQGDALGGGFEVALANDVIIAERQAQMGFPEIVFNLFPGMGALSLLSRRVGMQEAKRMVTSGKMYSAEELAEMKVIDILVDEGEGPGAVYEYLRSNERQLNALRAIQASCQRIQPVSLEELMDVTEIWIDAALRITEKDLRMMDRLVRRQRSIVGIDTQRKASKFPEQRAQEKAV